MAAKSRDTERGYAPPVRVVPQVPGHLDEKARQEIHDAQEVMRGLIARLPRRFGYGDEMGHIFRPHHDD